MFKPIIVIPFFNHGLAFKDIAPRLKELNVPIVVVNDGSTPADSDILNQICSQNHFNCIHREENGGKGAAVKFGLNWAIKNRYSHALQIDADGQHDLNDVFEFLDLAQKHPNNIITAQPDYDETAPKSRLYGRKVTNFWVFLETAGKLKLDTMCGFRVYPLEQIQKILPHIWFNRMGFDIEILVKSFLNNINITEKNTRVIYQENGVSHFRPVKDNIEISCVHTCLCVYSVWKFLTKWRH